MAEGGNPCFSGSEEGADRSLSFFFFWRQIGRACFVVMLCLRLTTYWRPYLVPFRPRMEESCDCRAICSSFVQRKEEEISFCFPLCTCTHICIYIYIYIYKYLRIVTEMMSSLILALERRLAASCVLVILHLPEETHWERGERALFGGIVGG